MLETFTKKTQVLRVILNSARFGRLVLLYVAIFSCLAGCTITRSGDAITIETDKQRLEEKLCAGLYELEQSFHNGSGRAQTTYYQLVTGRKFDNYIDFSAAERARLRDYLSNRTERRNSYINRLELAERNRMSSLDSELAHATTLESFMHTEKFRNKYTETRKRIEKEFEILDAKVGIQPFAHSNISPITKELLAPISGASLKNIHQHHVGQIGPETCWAASLQTAFQYLGYPYTQGEILATFRDSCPRKHLKSATLNQILFAASKRYSNGKGVWLGKFPSKEYVTVDLGELSKQFLGVHFDYQVTTGKPVVSVQETSTFNVNGHQFGQC